MANPQHAGTLDVTALDILQRLVGLFKRVFVNLGTDIQPVGQGQELLAIAPGEHSAEKTCQIDKKCKGRMSLDILVVYNL